MSSSIVMRFKNTRDKLCKAAAALGSGCLCDHSASSVIEYLINVEQIGNAIYEMVVVPEAAEAPEAPEPALPAPPPEAGLEEKEEAGEVIRKVYYSSSSASHSPTPSPRVKRERSPARRSDSRDSDKRPRARSVDKKNADPKSVYIRYWTGHDAFVGRSSVEGERRRLRNIFNDYARVDDTWVWYYDCYDEDKQKVTKIPVARVRFETEEAKAHVMTKAQILADRRKLFISTTNLGGNKNAKK